MTQTTLVLCGGRATRLGSLGANCPKVLIPIGGRPYVEYLFQYLREQCLNEIVLCTGYLAERIVEYCGYGSKWSLAIRYSHEETPLGTGGAIKNAQGLAISDPFWVINGDTLMGAQLEQVYADHLASQAAATLVLADVADVSRFGAVVMPGERSGWIQSFGEKAGTGRGLIHAGLCLVSRSVVSDLPSGRFVSWERDVLPKWVGRGLRGVVAPGPFVDIGTEDSLRQAHEVLPTWLDAVRSQASSGTHPR
jgi:NDP-sugar pyrophosphorylase family protein